MARARVERINSDALLVRRVSTGESDLIVTLVTEQRGLVSAAARSARRSWKRFAGIEPMHLLRVSLEERAGVEAMTLADATLLRARSRLTSDLSKLEAAGQALRWVRRASPPLTPEPGVWDEVNALLDRLDDDSAGAEVSAEGHLAAMGLRMLGAMGWGLDLDRCVRCGRECAETAAACIDPAAGGLICRACGGARLILKADRRVRMAAAMAGDDEALSGEDARQALELVEAALAAHSGHG